MVSGRPYQERAVCALRDLFRSGKRSVIAVAPTGSGKTHIGLMVVERILSRGAADAWWLAHRRELIEQPLRRFTEAGIDCAAYGAGFRDKRSVPVRIASVQTAVRRPIVPTRDRAVVFVDEGHRATAPTYREGILGRIREAYGGRVEVVLLTATPYRTDGGDLADVADALYEVARPAELIEEGWIVEPQVFRLPPPPDLLTCPVRGGEFVREEKAARIDRPKLVADIVETWLRLGDGQPTVGFAASVAHSRHLVERSLAAGIRAAHIDGTTPPEERSRTLARLSIGGRGSDHPEALDVVWNVDVLTEGWDSESDYKRVLDDEALWLGRSYPPEYVPLAVVVDADQTESMGKFRQREGRVTRPHPKKPFARLLCHTGNFDRHGRLRDHHGFELRQPLASLDAQKRERGVLLPGCTQCSACLAVLPSGAKACTYCGEGLGRAVELPREEAGELVLAEDSGEGERPETPSERVTFLAEAYREMWALNARRRDEGRDAVKPGFVRARFHARYGHWPNLGLLKRGEKLARGWLRAKDG